MVIITTIMLTAPTNMESCNYLESPFIVLIKFTFLGVLQ